MTNRAFVMASNGPERSSTLKYAEIDGKDIAEILQSHRCEFQVTSPGLENNKYQVLQMLEGMVHSCEPDDTFLFYFAGHGILERGKLYLVWEKREPDINLMASLPMSSILELVEQCSAFNKLVILDCCHAGAAAGVRDDQSALISDVVHPSENYIILCAGKRLQSTRELDEFQGSFLKKKISEALTEKFHEADDNSDQQLSFDELWKWLDKSWKALAPKEKRVLPSPHYVGSQAGTFYLTTDRTRWLPYEIPWADGSTMVVLPIRPLEKKVLCISKHPVTNAQYQRFVQDTGNPAPVGEYLTQSTVAKGEKTWKSPFYPWQEEDFRDPDQPVVCVSYDNALAYCKWVESLSTNQYHFQGSTFLPPTRLWHYAAFQQEERTYEPQRWLTISRQIHHQSTHPAPIDHTGARWNQWGISDLIGNVWEWCADIFLVAGSGYTVYRPVKTDLDRARQVENIGYRGGGFLDDLTKEHPYLDPYGWNIKSISHFDLGFRIAGIIKIGSLPEEQQIRLPLQKPCSEELQAVLLSLILDLG